MTVQTIQSNPWFFPLTPNSSTATARLFVFHYAGGSASAFRSWAKHLNPQIEIIGIQYPGRETRFMDEPERDIQTLVSKLWKPFSHYFDKPFLFFGHSLGAFVSFEFTRILQTNKSHFPQRLIVSGARAPHLPLTRRKIHHLSDKELLYELSKYNGVPKEILENQELIELFLPTIRADFTVSETYQYVESEPLSCPITAFGGLQDSYVPADSINAWQNHTNQSFKSYFFKGEHFFLRKESYSEVVKVVDDIVETSL